MVATERWIVSQSGSGLAAGRLTNPFTAPLDHRFGGTVGTHPVPVVVNPIGW